MMRCGDNLRHVRTKFCQLHTVLVTLHKPKSLCLPSTTPIRSWHGDCIDLPMNIKTKILLALTITAATLAAIGLPIALGCAIYVGLN